MLKLRSSLMWLTLALIVILTILSIYGAFIGAEKANVFFNSLPLACYWVLFMMTLLAGFLAFDKLRKAPSSLLVHAGCIAILIGGLLSSAQGQAIQRAWFGKPAITEGRMLFHNGEQHNKVYIAEDHYDDLPFDIKMDTFRVEYYPGTLYINPKADNGGWAFKTVPNTLYELGGDNGRIEIVQVFNNYKIDISNGQRAIYDAPGNSNPAVHINYIAADGTSSPHTIYQNMAGHGNDAIPFEQYYQAMPMVKDYFSDLSVVVDGNVVHQKIIEVNHPLYYGGYHFYQSSYDEKNHSFSILSVVSDTGLYWVYAGYILLTLGIIWQCWFIRLKQPVAKEAF